MLGRLRPPLRSRDLLFMCVTWLIHVCDVTHSHEWHDSFIRVTWLIHVCEMTHSYVWHDSFICVTWLVRRARHNTATHCNELENSATHYNTVQHMHHTHTYAGYATNQEVVRQRSQLVWRSHVANVKKSCRIYEGVMSPIWKCHVAHMKGSCCTLEWVVSRIWRGHDVHFNKSCRTFERVCVTGLIPSYVWHVWHDSFKYVWHVWHDSFLHMCDMCDMTHSSMCDMCDMTHSFICVTCVTWLIQHTDTHYHTYEGIMSRVCSSHVAHMNIWLWRYDDSYDSFICATWLYEDMTRTDTWHDCFICVIVRVCVSCHVSARVLICHTYEGVMSHVWMSHVAHMKESYRVMLHIWRSHIGVMSHVWMSHVAPMKKSYRKLEGVMPEWVKSHA